MAEVKQIMVVDDHFEMLEFLRSMLELSGDDCQVLAVPSAEEAFLELRRAHFDLLITDVRLPGMSGFDLVQRAKRLRPEMPVIMITAYSSPQGQQEAAELGVYRYFRKPLETDVVLKAVRTLLYGQAEEVFAPTVAAEHEGHISEDVRKRLEMLRADTGASRLMLATTSGNVLFTAGSNRQLTLPDLASLIAQSLVNSFHLADWLESDEPFIIHYQAGKTLELYSANVGHDYFVTLFFDVELRRGRIGTIWVFAQRAIRELVAMLPRSQVNQVTPEATIPATSNETLAPPVTSQAPAMDIEAAAVAETAGVPDGSHDGVNVAGDHEDVDRANAWKSLPEIDLATSDDPVDLDVFWSEALAGEGGGEFNALSLEEARRQGLIPKEFDVDEEGD